MFGCFWFNFWTDTDALIISSKKSLGASKEMEAVMIQHSTRLGMEKQLNVGGSKSREFFHGYIFRPILLGWEA